MGKKRIEIIKKLKLFKKSIEKEHAIEKIIFFGSRAKGKTHEFSDIDLIMVSKKFRKESPLKRPVALYLKWNLDLPVDFLCFTPKEFEKLKKQVSIVSHALKEGIAI